MAGNKKNIIPLVLAVVLALAAVFAVNRIIGQKTPMGGEEIVEVVVASRPLSPGDLINEGAFTKKSIPRSAAPSKAIGWNQTAMILNQKMKSSVSRGDYIVLDDIGDVAIGKRHVLVLRVAHLKQNLQDGDEQCEGKYVEHLCQQVEHKIAEEVFVRGRDETPD